MASLFSPHPEQFNRDSSPSGGLRRRALVAGGAVFALSFLIACAGVPPQRIALNSLQGIRDSVTTSLKVFNVGYQAGQFNEAQRTQLGVLYAKYLAADKIAAESLAVTTFNGDPTAIVGGVTIVAGDVLKFVQQLKGP